MRYTEFKALNDQLHAAGIENEREYALGDKVSLLVDFMLSGDGSFEIMLCLRYRNGCAARLDELTPAHLVKFAEIKAMIDHWKDGKIADLPHSTTDVVRKVATQLRQSIAAM